MSIPPVQAVGRRTHVPGGLGYPRGAGPQTPLDRLHAQQIRVLVSALDEQVAELILKSVRLVERSHRGFEFLVARDTEEQIEPTVRRE